MTPITELMKIAEIHQKRITYAINHLSHLFPIDATKLENISVQDFLVLELLAGRFAKLQDFMGAKLVDAFLEVKGENIIGLTMIDKINKLEKLLIIDDANLWFEMREVRNHLSHEYPDHPEITVKHLNLVFALAPQLLSFLKNMQDRL